MSQLMFEWSDDERESHQPPAVATEPPNAGDASLDVDTVAQQLRPRVHTYLADATVSVGCREIRTELGYTALDIGADPHANPVNRMLNQTRDAGELVCHQPERGEPYFSVPATDMPGNELPNRLPQLPVETDADSDHQFRAEHPNALEPAIRVNFTDGDVSIYAADGTWLASEASFDEALAEAELLAAAWRNGSHWAQHEIEIYRSHLQQHFPKIAARHGAPPVADCGDDPPAFLRPDQQQ